MLTSPFRRMSDWIRFPIKRFFDLLNEKERDIITETNKWSGSTNTGGSPRETGSRLSPSELEKIINDNLGLLHV